MARSVATEPSKKAAVSWAERGQPAEAEGAVGAAAPATGGGGVGKLIGGATSMKQTSTENYTVSCAA